MSLEIRNAAPGDEAAILTFIRELAIYENLEHELVATEPMLRQSLFCKQPKVFALIAEVNGEPGGFALYFFNYSTFLGQHGLYLEDLYVRENHRGAGIGKALLAQLARVAKENNCGRMEWWVLDWNTPSINFYKSLGAEAMDEWTVFRLTGVALENLAAQETAKL